MGIERLNEFWPEWRVESELGEGAFGKVYKAVDEEAGFPVYSAIKVLSIPSSKAELDALESEGITESESRSYFKGIAEDFVNEIKLMHTLKGAPNIVGVEQFKIAEKHGTVGWDIFIRMELLTSFKDYLKSHTPTEAEVVKLGMDIATALEVCQKRNIIHRDIKPANIFIDDFGSFKLGDFGIAKELEKTSGAVSAKGTFSYMAPEVARGMRYDNTVDIYSLGLVMYNLLNNNRPPFVDPHKAEVSYNDRKSANDRRLAGESLPAPCNASPDLAKIILMACSYDPARRFRTAAAFKNALLNYKNSPKAPTATPKPAEKKPDINETVAAKKPEEKPRIDETVAVPHKPEEKIKSSDQPEKEKKPKKKTIIAVTISLILIVAIFAMSIPSLRDSVSSDIDTPNPAVPKTEDPETNNSSEYPEISASSKVGDIVTFGHYEQDNNTSNGKEEIEWIVLEKRERSVLVISRYALDCQPYNANNESITWEDCTLREWLNDDFYNRTFSEDEKGKIGTAYVMTGDNPTYGTKGGDDTSDMICLLSIDEVEKYFISDEAMCCKATSYAKTQGVYIDSSNGNCRWWLRSPGSDAGSAAYVSTRGGVGNYGHDVGFNSIAVRPALWINLES